MEIITAFKKVHFIPKESEIAIANLVCQTTVKRNELILPLGKIQRNMYYVVKGAVRVFYLNNGIDVTDYFALNNQFIGAVESLFSQQPSHKSIETVEDSTLQYINYQKFDELCNNDIHIANLGRKLATFAFLEGQKRMEDIRFLTAAQRYNELLKKYPTITQHISLKHLASYLGTTQVSISRIRKGIQ